MFFILVATKPETTKILVEKQASLPVPKITMGVVAQLPQIPIGHNQNALVSAKI